MRLGLNLGYLVGGRRPARPAAADPARRGARLRRGLGGRGVRLGQPDRAGLAGRRRPSGSHVGLGGDADPGPDPGDDGDDRGQPRRAERRPVPARARRVRPAGVRGLARRAVRQAAGPDPGVRRHRPDRPGPADGGVRRRALPAAAAGRARQGAQADHRTGQRAASRSTWPPSDPKNLELAGEIADGWLAVFFAPEFAAEQLAHVRHGPGHGGADRSTGFDVVPTFPLVGRRRPAACADPVRPYAALYVGGMGSREQNFYNALAVRMGYADAAARGAGPVPGPAAPRRHGRGAVRVHRPDLAARRHAPGSPTGCRPWRRPGSPPVPSARTASVEQKLEALTVLAAALDRAGCRRLSRGDHPLRASLPAGGLRGRARCGGSGAGCPRPVSVWTSVQRGGGPAGPCRRSWSPTGEPARGGRPARRGLRPRRPASNPVRR